ncbi:YeiH family protein [Rhodoplanes sp. SY1]|uniref:YeiH family protein n=1 Tax=Rhodoplanes sp. SY1 TaxID=3166646 RepID=UPI0038B4F013
MTSLSGSGVAIAASPPEHEARVNPADRSDAVKGASSVEPMPAAEPTPAAAPGNAVPAVLRRYAPGLALAAAVALAALAAEPLVGRVLPIPAMVIALLIGVAFNRLAARPLYEPGLTYSVKKLLRIAIALLGTRIALGDIFALGVPVALLIVAGMAATIASGVWFARLLGLDRRYGALAGASTAVCGASAALATATVVPNYPSKAADVAFTVIAANAFSTLVMILYPPLCALLGLDPQATGIMLGGTVHDMAQVVGAGYAVSEPVGNTAVIVKLFRIFLLLPVVLIVGWWLLPRDGAQMHAKVPVPVFALVFLALCLVNSLVPAVPGAAALYAPVKAAFHVASTAGLLIAISALGLQTSPAAILRIGWRHVAVFVGATLVILAVVTGGLLALH